MRYLVPSLVAPAPILTIMFAVCGWGYFHPEHFVADLDDAPQRATAVFFMLTPIIYLVMVVILVAITSALGHFRLLSIRSLLYMAVISSLAFGIRDALDSSFGLKDQLISLFRLVGGICG